MNEPDWPDVPSALSETDGSLRQGGPSLSDGPWISLAAANSSSREEVQAEWLQSKLLLIRLCALLQPLDRNPETWRGSSLPNMLIYMLIWSV